MSIYREREREKEKVIFVKINNEFWMNKREALGIHYLRILFCSSKTHFESNFLLVEIFNGLESHLLHSLILEKLMKKLRSKIYFIF